MCVCLYGRECETSEFIAECDDESSSMMEYEGESMLPMPML